MKGRRGGAAAVVEEGIVRDGGLAHGDEENEVVLAGLAASIVERRHGVEMHLVGGDEGTFEEARLVDHQHGGLLGSFLCRQHRQRIEDGQHHRHQQCQHPEGRAAQAHAVFAAEDEQQFLHSLMVLSHSSLAACRLWVERSMAVPS